MEQLSPGGLNDRLWEAAFGPLRSVADFYIPFRLFQVEIINSGERDDRVLGLDAINGSLDPYHFEQLPSPGEVVYVDTRNYAEPLLDEVQGKALLVEKVRRLLFSKGFFRMRDLQISASLIRGEIYVPYWVGFRGRGMYARPAVIDAVRRRVEGAKVRNLLREWLTSTH